MAVKSDIPQVFELKQVVEKRFGHKLESRSDFSNLSLAIGNATTEHISENTLRRVWGRLKGYSTIYTHTLDVLCMYAGYCHWDDFCNSLKGDKHKESALSSADSYKVEDLRPGERFRIGWCPDRICIIEFQGGRTFKALDCQNSTLQNGDSFECGVMVKNFPLFVDNLVHGGEICNGYAMGLVSGLTILEKL